MGRVRIKSGDNKKSAFKDELREKMLGDSIKPDGSVTQPVEDRTFNPEHGGSSPSGPTTEILVVKACPECKSAMYIHSKKDEIIFSGCEPHIIDITLERVNEDEVLIRGKRSNKIVICSECKTKNLIRSFKKANGV